jgi:flavin-dependent dehydrogenase
MRVAIVGAGIIGSYIAWKLGEKGYDVHVFEQKKKPGKSACSGLISERVWEFIPENQKIVEGEIDRIEIKFPKKKTVLKPEPKFLLFNRKKLDEYVYSFADRYAKIFLSHKVLRVFCVNNTKPQLLIEHKGKRSYEEFDFVVGCDGPLSIVRNSLGIAHPKFYIGVFTYVKKSSKKDFVKTFATKNGFAWIIPRKKVVEYGVLEDLSIAKKEFEKFCRRQKIVPTKIFSGLVPQELKISQNPRVFLCGDAAGLCKPWSGGGVIWGLTAAQILIKNFPNVKKANSEMRKFFEPRVFFSKLSTKLVRFLGFHLPFTLPKEVEYDPDWIL